MSLSACVCNCEYNSIIFICIYVSISFIIMYIGDNGTFLYTKTMLGRNQSHTKIAHNYVYVN